MNLIGMEGNGDPSTPLTWGAAALQDGDRICNAVLKSWFSATMLPEVVAEGGLFLFEEPIAVEGRPEWVLRAQPSAIPAFLLDALAPHILPSGMHVVTFANLEAFKAWARPMADRLVAEVVGREERIALATILDVHGPRTQAAWVSLRPNSLRRRIGRAMMRSDEDRAEFDRLVAGAS